MRGKGGYARQKLKYTSKFEFDFESRLNSVSLSVGCVLPPLPALLPLSPCPAPSLSPLRCPPALLPSPWLGAGDDHQALTLQPLPSAVAVRQKAPLNTRHFPLIPSPPQSLRCWRYPSSAHPATTIECSNCAPSCLWLTSRAARGRRTPTTQGRSSGTVPTSTAPCWRWPTASMPWARWEGQVRAVCV